MNKELLIKLRADGYTFLVKKYDEKAYSPYMGNLEEFIETLSITPLKEDQIISIEDALDLADSEGLRAEMILLKNRNPE